MKKLFSSLLFAAMAISLAACSGETKKDKSSGIADTSNLDERIIRGGEYEVEPVAGYNNNKYLQDEEAEDAAVSDFTAADLLCNQLEELCGEMENAIKAGDEAETEKLARELIGIFDKMQSIDETSGEFTESHYDRIDTVLTSLRNTCSEYGVDLTKFQ